MAKESLEGCQTIFRRYEAIDNFQPKRNADEEIRALYSFVKNIAAGYSPQEIPLSFSDRLKSRMKEAGGYAQWAKDHPLYADVCREVIPRNLVKKTKTISQSEEKLVSQEELDSIQAIYDSVQEKAMRSFLTARNYKDYTKATTLVSHVAGQLGIEASTKLAKWFTIYSPLEWVHFSKTNSSKFAMPKGTKSTFRHVEAKMNPWHKIKCDPKWFSRVE